MTIFLHAITAALLAAALAGYRQARRARTPQAGAVALSLTAASVLGATYAALIAGRMP